MGDAPDEKLTEAEWAARLRTSMTTLAEAIPDCDCISIYVVREDEFGAAAWHDEYPIAEGTGDLPGTALDDLERAVAQEGGDE